MRKLKRRDPFMYRKLLKIKIVDAHPIFKVVGGGIEPWERIK